MVNTTATRPDDWPTWAVSGDKTRPPSDAYIAAGWPLVTDPPPRQYWNWQLNQVANGVRYMLQRGTPDWSASESYESSAIVQRGSLTYRALQASLGQDPTSAPTYWERWSYNATGINSLADARVTAGLVTPNANIAANTTAIAGLTTTVGTHTGQIGSLQTSVAGLIAAGTGFVTAQVTAGETLQVGDLVSVGADGLAYYGLENGTLGATLRPLSQTTTILNGLQAASILQSSVPVARHATAALLTNGNWVVGYLDASNHGAFQIFDPFGTPIAAPSVVTPADDVSSANNPISIAPLIGGGFAFVCASTTIQPFHGVYTNTGSAVRTMVPIETTTGVASVHGASLIDGGYVVTYYKIVSSLSQPHFARYNASGVLQGSITQIDTLTGGSTFAPSTDAMRAASLTGGGFVVGYGFFNGTDSSAKFAIYDASGSLVGSKTTVGSTATGQNSMQASVAGLTDGGFAICNYTSSAFSSTLGKYGATGTVVGTPVNIASAAINANRGAHVFSLGAGTYGIVWVENTLQIVNFRKYSTLAVIVGSNLSVDTTCSAPVHAVNLSDGGLAISYCKSASGSGPAAFTRLNSSYAIVGSAVSVASMTTTTCATLVPLTGQPSQCGPIFAMAYAGNGIGLGFGIYNASVQKMTLAGVVTIGNTIGNLATIQLTGSATLRVGFSQPYSIDARANATPGQKMSVMYKSAILLGIQ